MSSDDIKELVYKEVGLGC